MSSAQLPKSTVLNPATGLTRYLITRDGLSATLLNRGATLQYLYLDGHPHSLVLGCDQIELYAGCLHYAGAIVGPVANRIAQGHFVLGDTDFQVERNFLGRHCLHGGVRSPSDRNWTLIDHQIDSVIFGLEFQDKESGFPGPSSVRVKYSLDPAQVMSVCIEVSSPRLIPCNWTQHSYFNLDGSASLSTHELQVFADTYLPVNDELIPTGELALTGGTQFDYSELRPLGGVSLDHNFCISKTASNPLLAHARLRSKQSGISLLIESNAPGLQIYTGDHLRQDKESLARQLAGIAMEPQGWTDALNNPHFPSIELQAGDTYRHEIRYTFKS